MFNFLGYRNFYELTNRITVYQALQPNVFGLAKLRRKNSVALGLQKTNIV